MAKVKGWAGGTLAKKLIVVVLIILGVSLWGFIVGLTYSVYFAIFLAIWGLMYFFYNIWKDKEVLYGIYAKIKGWSGEHRVGHVLNTLPDEWRVFHDVDLGGENADHVVVGPRGVFTIEVKNYSGLIVARKDGLFINAERRDDIVKQPWRQARKLSEYLGVEVQPVLVFAGGKVIGKAAGRLPVLKPENLRAFLLSQPKRLSYAEAKQIFEKLEQKVKKTFQL